MPVSLRLKTKRGYNAIYDKTYFDSPGPTEFLGRDFPCRSFNQHLFIDIRQPSGCRIPFQFAGIHSRCTGCPSDLLRSDEVNRGTELWRCTFAGPFRQLPGGPAERCSRRDTGGPGETRDAICCRGRSWKMKGSGLPPVAWLPHQGPTRSRMSLSVQQAGSGPRWPRQ